MSYAAMVVDPDPKRVESFVGLLGSMGFETQTFRNGRQALNAIRLTPPALLITELSLPQLDGFSLLSHVAPLRPKPAVLVLSAFAAMRNEATQRKQSLGIDSLMPASASWSSIAKALAKLRDQVAMNHVDRPMGSDAPMETPRSADPVRLEAVRKATDLNAKEDPRLQALMQKLAQDFNVPIALITYVLGDRQWFKAHHGLKGELLVKRSTPLDVSFCRHVVDADRPLVVPDAASNPAFAQNPWVTSGAVRGYAGVPLSDASGQVLGTLCLVDTKPMDISAEEMDRLHDAAKLVEIELNGPKAI